MSFYGFNKNFKIKQQCNKKFFLNQSIPVYRYSFFQKRDLRFLKKQEYNKNINFKSINIFFLQMRDLRFLKKARIPKKVNF